MEDGKKLFARSKKFLRNKIYVNFINLKKSYMKLKLKKFIYDFLLFIEEIKINNKLIIKSP